MDPLDRFGRGEAKEVRLTDAAARSYRDHYEVFSFRYRRRIGVRYRERVAPVTKLMKRA